MGFLEDIYNEYFLRPVIDPTVRGYNLVNTAVYVTLLLLISFFIIFPFLDRKGIKFDKKFALALLPYILFGSNVRVLEMLGHAQKSLNPLETGFWFITPGVWFLTFALTAIGLLASRKIMGENYHKLFAAIGLVFWIPVFLFVAIHYTMWLAFIGTIIAIILVGQIVKFAVGKFTKTVLMKDEMNFLAMQGQAIDGTATAIAISFFNFTEQHPLSAGIIDVNPALFVIVKIVLILAILHYAEKDIKKENLRNFFKLFLIILGFATGMASVFKLGV